MRWAVNAAKTAGWIPGGQVVHIATSTLGASISAATTWGVGKAGVAFMQSQDGLKGPDIREIFNQAAFAWRDQHKVSP